MAKIWFTADTHLGHARIIDYCNRPFKSAEHQDAEIIKRFASVIRPGDVLYHLGDVSWSSYNLDSFFNAINTKEVHLIYGNHDKPKVAKHPYIRSYNELKRINIDSISITLCHYAMRRWSNCDHGAFQLYGHSHGKLPGEGRQMDVGVDTHDYYPYEWSEVKKQLLAIPLPEHKHYENV